MVWNIPFEIKSAPRWKRVLSSIGAAMFWIGIIAGLGSLVAGLGGVEWAWPIAAGGGAAVMVGFVLV